MSDALVHLDSSVVIGFLNADDAHHAEVVAAIKAARNDGQAFALSAITYAEVLVFPAIAGRSALTAAEKDLSRLFARGPINVDLEIARRTAELRAKHQWMSAFDSMILATAQIAGAKYLLTADERLARLPGVKLV